MSKNTHHRSCHDSMTCKDKPNAKAEKLWIWCLEMSRNARKSEGSSFGNDCYLEIQDNSNARSDINSWDPSLKAFCHSLLVDFFGQNHLPHRNSNSLARPFWFKLKCLRRRKICKRCAQKTSPLKCWEARAFEFQHSLDQPKCPKW
jgi:hypothetical protein